MRKSFLGIILVSVLLLADCAPATSPATDGQGRPTASLVARTSKPPATLAATTVKTAVQATSKPAGCSANPRPTLNPTEASIFPPINKQDWSLGPETASVVFLEYSDFQ